MSDQPRLKETFRRGFEVSPEFRKGLGVTLTLAAGTGSLTTTIGAVAQAAGETGSAAGRVLASADALTHQAEHLGAEVARFLQGVRAA